MFSIDTKLHGGRSKDLDKSLKTNPQIIVNPLAQDVCHVFPQTFSNVQLISRTEGSSSRKCQILNFVNWGKSPTHQNYEKNFQLEFSGKISAWWNPALIRKPPLADNATPEKCSCLSARVKCKSTSPRKKAGSGDETKAQ